MTLKDALRKALEESRNGYVQHVNASAWPGSYRVDDWYGGSATVASFENGQLIGYTIAVVEQMAHGWPIG